MLFRNVSRVLVLVLSTALLGIVAALQTERGFGRISPTTPQYHVVVAFDRCEPGRYKSHHMVTTCGQTWACSNVAAI